MKLQGRISDWQDDKGFGFVEPRGGGKRAFVHINSFIKPARRPVTGDLIVYVQSESQRGLTANSIQFDNDRQPSRVSNSRGRVGGGYARFGHIVTPLFIFSLLFALWLDKLMIEVLKVYGLLSFCTFITYGWDKSAAARGRWRTKESTLQILALLGGWPGGFYAQQWLRHKSSKGAFLRKFWLCALINMCCLGWLFTQQGHQVMHNVVNMISL